MTKNKYNPNSKTKFIFVTGGVVSSLGKGLASASLASLLQDRGFKVRNRKLDPYLNVNPGILSPYQHGEVFVTDDGRETDLDLGHYERFSGVSAKTSDSITTGQIYQRVFEKEKKGAYNGATIQVVPHITNEIKDFILSNIDDEDFILYEIGGTVGDIEVQPYLEAIRQVAYQLDKSKILFLHLTLLPYVATAGELKTKPTQHSVKKLQEYGIQPDMLLCRTQVSIPKEERKKIAQFCNIKEENVIAAEDISSIYEVPLAYSKEGIDRQVCKYFNLDIPSKSKNKKWTSIMDVVNNPEGEVSITVVGKYVKLLEAYKSLNEALTHGGIANKHKVKINWVDSETLNNDNANEILSKTSAIVVPGGFGERGIEGKFVAIEYARTHKIPFFGISFGMQIAVIESLRNVLGLKEANTVEFGETSMPVITLIENSKGFKGAYNQAGGFDGVLRLGSHEIDILDKKSLLYKIYKTEKIAERHRHRYQVNSQYVSEIKQSGLDIIAKSSCGNFIEAVEIKDHPWFLGVISHPELKSKPFSPHPLFTSFIKAAIDKSRLI